MASLVCVPSWKIQGSSRKTLIDKEDAIGKIYVIVSWNANTILHNCIHLEYYK